MVKRMIFILLIAVTGSILFSCNNKPDRKQEAATAVTYTCPMHPQVVRESPGTCPVCGMDLVVFDRSGTDVSITLNANQVALANISTLSFGDRKSDDSNNGSVQLNGRIVINPENVAVISSRVGGRLENLYLKEIGAEVKKGQRIYRIYSEELASLQQEYLVSLAQLKHFPADQQFARIEKSARNKLVLYGQAPAQIKALAESGKSEPYTFYTSPSNGIVAELMVAEGQYVEEGAAIMRIEGYDELWVEADVYAGEASLIKNKQEVEVFIEGFPASEKVSMNFTNPELSAGSQLLQVRGKIKNRNNMLRPGMRARISLVGNSGEVRGDNLVPSNAIVRSAASAHVWVELDSGRYEPRMVTVGKQHQQMTEIVDGLDEEDKVVITGAYLLNSEYILKRGKDPMAAHHH